MTESFDVVRTEHVAVFHASKHVPKRQAQDWFYLLKMVCQQFAVEVTSFPSLWHNQPYLSEPKRVVAAAVKAPLDTSNEPNVASIAVAKLLMSCFSPGVSSPEKSVVQVSTTIDKCLTDISWDRNLHQQAKLQGLHQFQGVFRCIALLIKFWCCHGASIVSGAAHRKTGQDSLC